MAYEYLARYYEQLMEDVDYEFLINLVKKYTKANDRILDVGCGTGQIMRKLSREGLNVDGIDISEDMLVVAQEIAREEGLNLNFFEQDIRNLSGTYNYNLIYSFLDTINYITEENDVKMTFENIYNSLDKNGIFIFDVHSEYKVNNILNDYSYNDTSYELTYIWNSFSGNESNSIYHQLTFFIPQENYYIRLDEDHYQRTFSKEVYSKLLTEVGFKIDKIFIDFDNEKQYKKTCNRIFFIVNKQ